MTILYLQLKLTFTSCTGVHRHRSERPKVTTRLWKGRHGYYKLSQHMTLSDVAAVSLFSTQGNYFKCFLSHVQSRCSEKLDPPRICQQDWGSWKLIIQSELLPCDLFDVQFIKSLTLIKTERFHRAAFKDQTKTNPYSITTPC